MPIYEFRCKKCKNIFESLIFSPKDEKTLICPKCGGKQTERVMSASARRKSKGSSGSAGSSCSASSCPPGCSCH